MGLAAPFHQWGRQIPEGCRHAAAALGRWVETAPTSPTSSMCPTSPTRLADPSEPNPKPRPPLRQPPPPPPPARCLTRLFCLIDLVATVSIAMDIPAFMRLLTGVNDSSSVTIQQQAQFSQGGRAALIGARAVRVMQVRAWGGALRAPATAPIERWGEACSCASPRGS
jgi:hypothetical protein